MVQRFVFSGKAVSLFVVSVFLVVGAGFGWAYDPGGAGGSPSVMGHSVDELDWSKPLPGNLLVNGNIGIGTTVASQQLIANL